MSENEVFQFYLTPTQSKTVIEAEKQSVKYYKEGKKGAIFCQIGKSLGSNESFLVKGSFIPQKEAEQIQKIIAKIIG